MSILGHISCTICPTQYSKSLPHRTTTTPSRTRPAGHCICWWRSNGRDHHHQQQCGPASVSPAAAGLSLIHAMLPGGQVAGSLGPLSQSPISFDKNRWKNELCPHSASSRSAQQRPTTLYTDGAIPTSNHYYTDGTQV